MKSSATTGNGKAKPYKRKAYDLYIDYQQVMQIEGLFAKQIQPRMDNDRQKQR